jgi:AraC-like DNA-binding protein
MSSPDWRIGSGDQAARIASGAVTEAAGPAWSGRFERMTFGPGFHMHLGRLDVAGDSEVPVTGLDEGPAPISVFTLISGKAVLHMPAWPDLTLSPGGAILFRPKERWGIFRLSGPQVLRFFSVAMAPDLLASLLDGGVPPALAAMTRGDVHETVVRERPVGAATRALVAGLGAPRETGGLQRLQRESVAIQLLLEVVGAEAALAADSLTLHPHEDVAVRAARDRLLQDLRDPPSAVALAERSGLGLRRFLRAFEQLHGASPAQVLRTERLNRARQLLEAGELSLKEIAWQVGYSHLSNFVSAFAERFGLPPRQFQRRAAAE